MLVRAAQDLPRPRQQFAAVLCWLSAEPLQPARSYVLQHATRGVKSRVAAVCDRLDLHALAWLPAAGGAAGATVGLNDIVRVQMKTQQPLVADAYAASRTTGSFILIDEATNDTVAAGMIEPQADA
jgi:sulfate adenylyltransferase subunit 1